MRQSDQPEYFHRAVPGGPRLLDQRTGHQDGLGQLALLRQRTAEERPAVAGREAVAERVGEVSPLLAGRLRGDRVTGDSAGEALVGAQLRERGEITRCASKIRRLGEIWLCEFGVVETPAWRRSPGFVR